MGLNTSQYIDRSNDLVSTGRQLLTDLESRFAPQSALEAIEDATKQPAAGQLGYGASPSILDDEKPSPDDDLLALLYDFQSANLLIAAGIATEGPNVTPAHLKQAISQIETTQSEMTASSSLQLEFEPGSLVKSAGTEDAKQTFRTDSDYALDQIVEQTESLLTDALEQLEKLNGSKVQEALDRIGQSFKAVADVGRLVRKGIEQLKAAIQRLFDMLGQAGLGAVKDQATQIWNKFAKGDYSKELLKWLFGVKDTQDRIEARFKRDDLTIDKVDSASNNLRPLSDDYLKKMRILKALAGALTLIAAAVGFFHITVPWLPLVLAVAYVTLIGSAVVIGMNYSGVSNALPWVTGVREIANQI